MDLFKLIAEQNFLAAASGLDPNRAIALLADMAGQTAEGLRQGINPEDFPISGPIVARLTPAQIEDEAVKWGEFAASLTHLAYHAPRSITQLEADLNKEASKA